MHDLLNPTVALQFKLGNTIKDSEKRKKELNMPCCAKVQKGECSELLDMTPIGVSNRGVYNLTPIGVSIRGVYNLTPIGVSNRGVYNLTPKGVSNRAVYNLTPKGVSNRAVYNQAGEDCRSVRRAWKTVDAGLSECQASLEDG